YREETHVDPGSVTPTFVALPFYIDNWRWAGVPFYIRTGKRLERRVTEITIEFRQPPLRLFGRTCDQTKPNILTFSIQPDESITLSFSMKHPHGTSRIHEADFTFNYKEAFHFSPHSTYERQLLDTMRGNLTLFARTDEIETMWAIVDPIIEYFDQMDTSHFPNYDPGGWGPDEADALLEDTGRRWHIRQGGNQHA
ncbi:MAG: glucose-6-phosphate dehydrogenase, partial [Spirochaetota bacterium]